MVLHEAKASYYIVESAKASHYMYVSFCPGQAPCCAPPRTLLPVS